MKGATTICILLSLIAIVVLLSGCTGVNQPAPTATPAPATTTQPTTPPPTYEITGTVRDYMGLPVYNAKVTIWQNDKVLNVPNNPQYSSYGDTLTMGQYDFRHVPKGTYKITAELNGQSGSITYPENGLTDIIMTTPTITPVPSFPASATPPPITAVYSVSFNIERSTNRDIIITNTGGDTAHLQTVKISFVDKAGTLKGPGTSLDMVYSGVTGDLNRNVGSTCDIDGNVANATTQVSVYGIFDNGTTMQVLSMATV